MLLILYYIVEANVLNRSGFHVHSGLWRQANQDATESIKPDLVSSFSVSSLSLLLHLHPWPLSSNLLNTPHRQSSHIVKSSILIFSLWSCPDMATVPGRQTFSRRLAAEACCTVRLPWFCARSPPSYRAPDPPLIIASSASITTGQSNPHHPTLNLNNITLGWLWLCMSEI